MLSTLHARPPVRNASGIPCALYLREGHIRCITRAKSCRENVASRFLRCHARESGHPAFQRPLMRARPSLEYWIARPRLRPEASAGFQCRAGEALAKTASRAMTVSSCLTESQDGQSAHNRRSLDKHRSKRATVQERSPRDGGHGASAPLPTLRFLRSGEQEKCHAFALGLAPTRENQATIWLLL